MIRALSEEHQDEYYRIEKDFWDQYDSGEKDIESYLRAHASAGFLEEYEAVCKEADELRAQGIMV